MDFKHESNRIYSIGDNNEVLAEITFPSTDSDTVDINHTFVHSSLGGQGLAGKLMEAAVSDLRAQGKKAVLTCSYAVNWFEKHPEHKDILK